MRLQLLLPIIKGHRAPQYSGGVSKTLDDRNFSWGLYAPKAEVVARHPVRIPFSHKIRQGE